jgi:hypothetical protein
MIITPIAKIGKYKNDLFWISSEKEGKYLIHTGIPEKAKKYNMEGNDYDGFDLRVSKEEVELLYDFQHYRRKLFSIDLEYRNILKNLSNKKMPVDERLMLDFKKNGIILSTDSRILRDNNDAWSIMDKTEQYLIKDIGSEINVHNGGII